MLAPGQPEAITLPKVKVEGLRPGLRQQLEPPKKVFEGPSSIRLFA